MTKLLKAVLILVGILTPILSGMAYVSEKLNDYVRKDSFSLVLDTVNKIDAKIDKLDEKLEKHREDSK